MDSKELVNVRKFIDEAKNDADYIKAFLQMGASENNGGRPYTDGSLKIHDGSNTVYVCLDAYNASSLREIKARVSNILSVIALLNSELQKIEFP